MSSSAPDGPVERFPAPARLDARVVDPEGQRAIHGYALEEDLARGFALHELFVLSLTGQAPSRAVGQAAGMAMAWICAPHVGESPAHVAVLARTSGATPAGLAQAVAITCAAEASAVLQEHAALLDALDAGTVPDSSGPPSRWDVAVREATGLCLPGLGAARSVPEASLTALHGCGLEGREQLEVAWTWARQIGALAEGLAAPRLGLLDYPLRLPPFRYVEGSE